jgi:hypothetical protein
VAFATSAMMTMGTYFLPHDGATDPIWQQPFHALSLIVPPVLDSCFTLLRKLPRRQGGASSSSLSSYLCSGSWDRSILDLVRTFRASMVVCMDAQKVAGCRVVAIDVCMSVP